jgi:hypothetical protein
MTPEQQRRAAVARDALTLNNLRHARRGAEIAFDSLIMSALHRRFGGPRGLLRELGFDEATSTEMIDSYKEDEMPLPHRRAGDTSRIRSLSADRRRPFRAMDEGEDPVEFIRELIGQLEPEELERLGGDRRRARDESHFSGAPQPGGEMDPLDKYRQPGETRAHAQDRRRHAYDQLSDSRASRDARDDFARRFPSAAGIKIMG